MPEESAETAARSASRFALLELNDDLLRSVLLLCGVDSLRALHRVSTKLRKLSHETLRLAKWRELPGNSAALRDALWLAGQFTTRIVGASNSDSMNEAFIQDGRLIASNHSDEVSCFESKTGRFVFGMDVEVGKIAVQGDTLAIGLTDVPAWPGVRPTTGAATPCRRRMYSM